MKVIYNPSTGKVSRYPRNDDELIVGLNSSLLIMELIEESQPSYEPDTQQLNPTTVIDEINGTVTRGWEVVTLPTPPPGPNRPDYEGFEEALTATGSLMTANRNRMVPTITLSQPTTLAELRTAVLALGTANNLAYEWGRFSASLDTIIQRFGDGNNESIKTRFQARLWDWVDAANFGNPAKTTIQGLLDQYLPTRNYTAQRP
jgi:hypothetical protein